MKNRHTTSAEKAVVLVFMVAAPLGFTLGYNFKQVPEPVVEEKIVVRTVNVGDYEWAKDGNRQGGTSTGTDSQACTQAVEDFDEVRNNLDQHNMAVSQLTGIIQDLYPIVSGNSDDPVGDTNRVAGDLEQHKWKDWTRLSADGARLDALQASINQCAGITNEGE